jgi:hypothetical protein
MHSTLQKNRKVRKLEMDTISNYHPGNTHLSSWGLSSVFFVARNTEICLGCHGIQNGFLDAIGA